MTRDASRKKAIRTLMARTGLPYNEARRSRDNVSLEFANDVKRVEEERKAELAYWTLDTPLFTMWDDFFYRVAKRVRVFSNEAGEAYLLEQGGWGRVADGYSIGFDFTENPEHLYFVLTDDGGHAIVRAPAVPDAQTGDGKVDLFSAGTRLPVTKVAMRAAVLDMCPDLWHPDESVDGIWSIFVDVMGLNDDGTEKA